MTSEGESQTAAGKSRREGRTRPFDRAWIEQMIRNSGIPPEQLQFIHHDVRYWKAALCGWDVGDERLARSPCGQPCALDESAFWDWWTKDLHWTQREMLIQLSQACTSPAPIVMGGEESHAWW